MKPPLCAEITGKRDTFNTGQGINLILPASTIDDFEVKGGQRNIQSSDPSVLHILWGGFGTADYSGLGPERVGVDFSFRQ